MKIFKWTIIKTDEIEAIENRLDMVSRSEKNLAYALAEVSAQKTEIEEDYKMLLQHYDEDEKQIEVLNRALRLKEKKIKNLQHR